MKQPRLALLYAIFFVSGSCGLIYESIWTHYLKLILGHAAHAQAVVLVVFVGGLALGAWLAGTVSHRLRRPIMLYAAVEALVALIAFAFHEFFLEASGWALSELLPAVCAGDGLCWAQWALAAGLILVPSVLLGATFPLMSAGVLRSGVGAGHGLSLLYFLNSAGAALGVLVCGYVLVPEYGLPGTLLVAGSLNAAVALGAYVADLLASGSSRGRAEARTGPGPAAEGRRWLLWVAALTGLSSFIYEVVWIRMLTQVLGAATHSFELMLASFIFGLALGGLWVRHRIDRSDSPERLLAVVQIVMGILAVATLPLYLWSFDAMAFMLKALVRSEPGYTLFNITSAAVAMAVILPATICAGMTLPVITAALLRRGHGEGEIGRVYAANTFGAIVGVLAAVYLLMPMLGLKWALACGAALDIGLGAAIFRKLRGPRARALAIGAPTWVAAGVAAVVLVPAGAPFDPARLSSGVYRTANPDVGPGREVLFNEDGRTATITVIRSADGLRTLRTNGKPDGSSYPTERGKLSEDDATVYLLGLLGPAHHPGARHAAVVGLGTGLTSAALLGSSRIETVDTIEIEPKVLEAAQLFRPANAPVFDDPRSRIIVDDARAHFARAPRRYDLIISEPSNPWVSGVSGLFTTEFYGRAATQLAPGGHFVQWLHLYEAGPQMVGSILTAFGQFFPQFNVYASNRGDVILVGRGDGLPAKLDPAIFGMPQARARLAAIGIDNFEMLAAHDVGPGNAIKLLYGDYRSPSNSDYQPYVDSRAAKDRFMGENASALQWLNLAPVPVLEFSRPSPVYLGKVSPPLEHMPTHLLNAATAGLAERYLRGLPVGTNALRVIAPSLKDLELTRSWLAECRPSSGSGPQWDAVLAVAAQTIPNLPPDRAARLWDGFRNGPCRSRFTPAQAEWLDLFAAVGGRRPQATQDAADVVLRRANELTAKQHEYALLAVTAARLALGRNQEAATLFAQHVGRIPADRLQMPWFRYQQLVLRTQPLKPGAPAAPAQ